MEVGTGRHLHPDQDAERQRLPYAEEIAPRQWRRRDSAVVPTHVGMTNRRLDQRIKEYIVLDLVIAVGDGANVLPMLGIAGLGIAFHAKPKVRESAKQQISTAGLDGILYLIGVRDRDVEPLTRI